MWALQQHEGRVCAKRTTLEVCSIEDPVVLSVWGAVGTLARGLQEWRLRGEVPVPDPAQVSQTPDNTKDSCFYRAQRGQVNEGLKRTWVRIWG